MSATDIATKIIKQIIQCDPMERQKLIPDIAEQLEAWRNA